MAESIICTRSFAFAGQLLNLGDRIWERGPSPRHISSQLMRANVDRR
jgi:hypothetical protein